MKRVSAFIFGFLAVYLPLANHLAKQDAEPDMAGLSLMLFGCLALLLSLGANTLFGMKRQALGRSLHSLFSGIICALAFYLPLAILVPSWGLFPTLAASFVLAMLLAAFPPLLIRSKPE